ncbi:unnamed protein product [Pseudo-nitzschia multistriata]|uniref:Uncharacterized protein n=1 Tax=Pseudo-nitzschia multistriata TaxID=183589 RepID=A0A448Z6F2_9STRA|nr:unnamed protein product [Pseudo-nitzschia multistriata]
MKFFGTPQAAMAAALSVASSTAFAPMPALVHGPVPLSAPHQQRRRRGARGTTTGLASSRQEDAEDRIVSLKKSWSDQSGVCLPSEETEAPPALAMLGNLKKKYWKLPPAPEDQFIMTGDIFTLFLYAFTSHSINDAIVGGLLEDPSLTIPEAVRELDPLQTVVKLQTPVWVDLASNPNVPFGNPSVDHALEVTARESLMNHWGILLSTEGSACVALCTCWLVAGYLHRSFSFDNSTYCGGDKALTKTVETWATAALLLAWCAAGAEGLAGHFPALQALVCGQCHPPSQVVLTQSDLLFVVDSLTVLIAWRWSAHRILNTFR